MMIDIPEVVLVSKNMLGRNGKDTGSKHVISILLFPSKRLCDT